MADNDQNPILTPFDVEIVKEMISTFPDFQMKLAFASLNLEKFSASLDKISKQSQNTAPVENKPAPKPVVDDKKPAEPVPEKPKTDLKQLDVVDKQLSTLVSKDSPLLKLSSKFNKGGAFSSIIDKMDAPMSDMQKTLGDKSKKMKGVTDALMGDIEGFFGKDSFITKMAGKFTKSKMFGDVLGGLGGAFGGDSEGGMIDDDEAEGINVDDVSEGMDDVDVDADLQDGAKEDVFSKDDAPMPVIIKGFDPDAMADFQDAMEEDGGADDKSKDGDKKEPKDGGGLFDNIFKTFSSGLSGLTGNLLKSLGGNLSGLIGGAAKMLGPAAGVLAAGAAGYALGTAIDKKFGISEKVGSLWGERGKKKDAINNLQKNLKNYESGMGNERLGELFRSNFEKNGGASEQDPISRSKWMDAAFQDATKQYAAESKPSGGDAVPDAPAGGIEAEVEKYDTESVPEVEESMNSVAAEASEQSKRDELAERAVAENSAILTEFGKISEVQKEGSDAVVSAVRDLAGVKSGGGTTVVQSSGGSTSSPARDSTAYDDAYILRSRYWTSYTRGF